MSPRTYSAPASLRLNEWALSGDWTIEGGASVLNGTEGAIAFRFHARDAHLILPCARESRAHRCRSACSSTEKPPGDAHRLDVDELGEGTVSQPRLYQLVRLRDRIADRTLEIDFRAPGVEAYVFTFGYSRVGCNRLNLDLAAKWQRSCLIRQARWETRNVCEGLTVGTIDCVVVADVRERNVN